MAFSIAETVHTIVSQVLVIKSEKPTHPVTVILPNISMIQSLNRALLESGKPLLNIRAETFYQHVHRIVEPDLINRGISLLADDQANTFVQRVLDTLKLKYFSAACDFSSYVYYFVRAINDLRLNTPPEKLKESLSDLGEKGTELNRILEEFLVMKKDRADYADMLSLYTGTDETLVLFPGVEDEMTRLETLALHKNPDVIKIVHQECAAKPTCKIKNPLYMTLEIKDVFREIIQLGASFDQTAIIAPSDYITPVLEEAKRLGVPVFCPHGEEILLDQLEVFKTVLDVINSGYTYQTLKHFFQLQGHFAPIQALVDCGVAIGRETIQKSINSLVVDKKKERHQKLQKALESFEKIEKLKKTPHKMGEAVLDLFILGSHQKFILKGILEDLAQNAPGVDYEKWEKLVREKLARVKGKSDNRRNSIFLTTDFLPGSFPYVFMLGIKEGSFPSKFREDPLLLDHERIQINSQTGGTLKTAKEKNQKLAENLNTAIACAQKGWFGYFPTMDLISGDEQFASFYLIDIVKQLKQKDIISKEEYQDFLDSARQPWMFESPDQCLDYFDWSVHHLVKGSERFVGHVMATQESALRHFQAHCAYWNGQFDEYSGFVDMDGRKKQSNDGVFSATELESYMTCPYRWFVERQLGVRPLEEPATLEKPDALIIGTILHEVLELYMKKIQGTKHDRKKLTAIIHKTIDSHIASTGVIAPVYMERLRSQIRELTDTFMEHEETYIKDGRKPAFFEFAFGTRHKVNTLDDPIVLKLGKHQCKFSGSIDRIDVIGDEAIIIDYKSSAAKNYTSIDYAKGQRLQPALYAEAFMAAKNKALKIKNIQSGYLPLRGNSKEYVIPHDKERKAKLERISNFIFDSMKIGCFFTTGNCDWCNFENICGKGIAAASNLKLQSAAKDKRVAALAKEYKAFEEF